MQNLLVLGCLLAFLATNNVFAGNAELFEIDRDFIKMEFQELNELEGFVMANSGMSFNDLMKSGYAHAINLTTLSPLGASFAFKNGGPLGIPSFLWGCAFGVVGILVVYLVTEEKDQAMKSLWGCVTGTVVWTIAYVAYVAWIIDSTDSGI